LDRQQIKTAAAAPYAEKSVEASLRRKRPQFRFGHEDETVLAQHMLGKGENSMADPITPGVRRLLDITPFGECVEEALNGGSAEFQPSCDLAHADGFVRILKGFEYRKTAFQRKTA
jgi:hypothetical protein